MTTVQRVLDIPYVDQMTYSGNIMGAGQYLCSAAALTMALRHFLGTHVRYDAVATALMDEGYLDERGLLSGDYLARFVCRHWTEYPVAITYANRPFDADYLVRCISAEKLVVAVVPGHYTLIAGFRRGERGDYVFFVADPYKHHWAADAPNCILRNDWLTEGELSVLWQGRHTLIAADRWHLLPFVCAARKILRKLRTYWRR